MTNEIDLLMATDWMNATQKDIDAVIEYQRKARANLEAGVKPKRPTGPKQDLSSVMAKLSLTIAPPAGEPMKRRR